MSKGFKKVLGFAAALVVPFAAPVVAGAIGVSSTLGTALVGAGLGGLASAATGGDPLTGALLGGIGGYTAGSVGAAGRAAAGGAAGGKAGTIFDLFSGPAPGSTASIMGSVPGSAAGVAAGVAASGAGYGAAGGGLASVLSNPAQLARITLMASGGMSSDGLSSAEKQLVARRRQELEQLAATNEALFRHQLSEAQKLLSQSSQYAPQNVAAVAEAGVGARLDAEREEALRGIDARNVGLRVAEDRRYRIARGSQRAAAYQRGLDAGARTSSDLTSAAVGLLPRSAPEKFAGLMLPLEQGISERRRVAEADRARLFGGLFA